ncbi:etoposide-induced protein 2.4 homolog [Bradysia coprophila]|uniref:etoposide-induced protein 2.4 homolog n=1 Tax=Bradysia coprophila TaxID=38358 RepID=UPI00187D82B3|nr:etoposide-induced protein 2.4 homolog [Bradysia coprophila]
MNQIKNITKEIAQGFCDSISGIVVVFYLDREVNKKLQSQQQNDADGLVEKQKTTATSYRNKETPKRREESKVLKRVLECCALNGGVFYSSILIFDKVLLPLLRFLLTKMLGEKSKIALTLWSWMQPVLSILFGMIWVMPLFCLSRIVNSLWFQDIADSAFKFRKGRPQLIPSISKLIADVLFSLVVQALFLVQSMVVRLLPVEYLGAILCFVHMCMLYSLYSFEYKWFNMGWELHKRLTYIETNWPYFIGFGMPLAILTQLPSSQVVSGCIFACLFPFFILSGNEATPKQSSCDINLRLFSPVVAISNALFSKTVQAPVPPTPIAVPKVAQYTSSSAKLPNPSPAKISSSSSRRGSTPTSHRSSPSMRSSSHRN